MVTIDEQYCKGCSLCIHYCPKKVLDKSNTINGKGYTIPFVKKPEECTQCKTCELICPELAINAGGEAE